jgi:hypothetical protein
MFGQFIWLEPLPVPGEVDGDAPVDGEAPVDGDVPTSGETLGVGEVAAWATASVPKPMANPSPPAAKNFTS